MQLFYFVQGEPGEDVNHPNTFHMQAPVGRLCVWSDVELAFPLSATIPGSRFHIRYRVPGPEGYDHAWADISQPNAPVPFTNGNIFIKVLRLGMFMASELLGVS